MGLIKEVFRDKSFLKRTWAILLPVTVQTMLNMITNMVDTVMIGSLGEIPIGAVGLANKVFFVVTLMIFGVGSGMGLLAAQYWGNNDIKNIRRVTGIGLTITLIMSVIITVFCMVSPVSVMKIFTDSEALAQEGARYLRIACLTYPILAITVTFNDSLRSMGVVKPAVYVSAIAIVVNVFFNYVLIFGNLGMPALGVEGAAIATLIARISELVIGLYIIRRIKAPIYCNPKYLFNFDRALLKQFFVNALPVCFNELFWGLGITMYSLVYGRMGENVAAIMTIVGTYTDIEIVGINGLASATVIMLGNELGAGELETADRHSKYFLVLSVITGALLMFITFVVAKPFTTLYSVSAESVNSIIICLFIFAFTLIPRCVNNIIIVGILRSGGDSIVCAMLDLMPLWFVAVPLVFFTGLVLKLPITYVYACIHTDEIIKFVLGLIRYSKKKWLKNLALELTVAQAE